MNILKATSIHFKVIKVGDFTYANFILKKKFTQNIFGTPKTMSHKCLQNQSKTPTHFWLLLHPTAF